MNYHPVSENSRILKGKNSKTPNNFKNFQKKTKIIDINLFRWLSFSKNKKHVKYRFLVFLFGVVDKDSYSNFYLEQLKDIYFHNEEGCQYRFFILERTSESHKLYEPVWKEGAAPEEWEIYAAEEFGFSPSKGKLLYELSLK